MIPLDCQGTSDQLSHYLDREVSEETRQGLLGHLHTCSTCRTRWEAMRKVDQWVQGLPRRKSPQHLIAEELEKYLSARKPVRVFNGVRTTKKTAPVQEATGASRDAPRFNFFRSRRQRAGVHATSAGSRTMPVAKKAFYGGGSNDKPKFRFTPLLPLQLIGVLTVVAVAGAFMREMILSSQMVPSYPAAMPKAKPPVAAKVAVVPVVVPPVPVVTTPITLPVPPVVPTVVSKPVVATKRSLLSEFKASSQEHRRVSASDSRAVRLHLEDREFVPANLEKRGLKRAIFVGQVTHGQSFDIPFGNGYLFQLVPQGSGWEIRIAETNRPTENLCPHSVAINGQMFPRGVVPARLPTRHFSFNASAGGVNNGPSSQPRYGKADFTMTSLNLAIPQKGGTPSIEQMEFRVRILYRE